MKNLVIVESPTKARTIGRFLGKDYDIKYSMGHIIDLPKSKLSVDVDHDFTPQYEVIPDKQKIITELKTAAKDADLILLATDPDREGEAISYQIAELLGGIKSGKSTKSIKRKAKKGESSLGSSRFQRIVFHEITEDAIKEALLHPRDVDTNLVNAQTARRVLDRLVGYQLSPLLWQKVRRGLSAGRVQSVALRLIVEREREIEKFKREDYYTIIALLTKKGSAVISTRLWRGRNPMGSLTNVRDDNAPIPFELMEVNGGKIEAQRQFSLYDGEYKITKTTIQTPEQAEKIVSDMRTRQYTVSDVAQRESRRSPSAPYITSTLQQDASRRLGLTGKRTMSLAQKLYEEGYITYHRTDSVILSTQAISTMRKYIEKTYGEKYIPEKPRVYTTKQKLAQEAHEGIRPTKIERTMDIVEKDLGREFAKLYELIWRRAISSQMSDALIESTTVFADSDSAAGKAVYRLKANGSVLVFDGFLKVNPQALQDTRLPQYENGESLKASSINAEKHETPAPPRYNDASIISTLEEKGIGRPSTYASIISTLVDRAYVERIERRFEPTAIGMAVNDFLVTNFSDIDDIPFTANMEDDLDEVANGKKEWVKMMAEFYKPFAKKIEAVKETGKRVKIEVEQTDELCPECKQENLVIRTGKFGKFFSCSRFPDCKFTKPFVEETNFLCPKCGLRPDAVQGTLSAEGSAQAGGKVIIKKTRKGRKFFGCSNYPNCDFAAWKMEDIKQGVKDKTSTFAKATADKQNAKVQVKS